MENSSTNKVFISHAGSDSDSAKWIAEGLNKAGIEVHLDQNEIRAGDNIITWMNNSIGESDYMLLLLSPFSVNRYWVEMAWSNALMKEAQLRRTFVIPALLPGLDDTQIPSLLLAKAYIDFRDDREKAFLQLVNRVKEDQLVKMELGRFPSPSPNNINEHLENHFSENCDKFEVIIHSNRFGRSFRVSVPSDATPSYIMGMLRETLKLSYSNIDDTLGVQLSYTYYLYHKGSAITLNTKLKAAGVNNGDKLELRIKVTLRDLLEDKEIGEKVFFKLYNTKISNYTTELKNARNRAFSSTEIKRIASQFFKHVDDN